MINLLLLIEHWIFVLTMMVCMKSQILTNKMHIELALLVIGETVLLRRLTFVRASLGEE